MRIPWGAIVLVIAAAAPLGCQSGPRTPSVAGPAEVGSPFAPAQMRLHPLSRVDRDDQGRAMIVAYLELRDAWGHNTKGIGQLQIQLYRPAANTVSQDEQELKWDLDLSDLDLNSRLFDPVTHMYRLPLLEAPAWVLPEPGRVAPRVRLRMGLTTFGPDGSARLLEHDGTIGS